MVATPLNMAVMKEVGAQWLADCMADKALDKLIIHSLANQQKLMMSYKN